MYKVAISIPIIEDEVGVIIISYLPFVPIVGQKIEYVYKGIMYSEIISEVTICLDEFDIFQQIDVLIN